MITAYMLAGRYEETENYVDTLLQMDPGRSDLLLLAPQIAALRGEYQQALSMLAELRSESPFTLKIEAVAHHQLGRTDQYERIVRQLSDLGGPVMARELLIVHAAIGDKDTAFHWMEEYFETTPFHGLLTSDPVYDVMKQDPRWDELMGHYGISQRQLIAAEFPTNIPH